MADQDRLYRTDTGARTGVAYDEGLRSYMLGVYNYMALGIAATGLLAIFFLTQPNLIALFLGTPLRFLPFVGILGLGFIGPNMIMNSRNSATGHALFWGYVAMWGLLVGPVAASFIGAGLGMIVAKAFFISASVFAAVSLYGYTTKRDLSGMQRFLMMAGVGLLVAVAFTWLFPGQASPMMSFGLSALIVLFISALTAYETQMIKNFYVEGAGDHNQRASICGAFLLYGSFASLFLNILNMLGLARD